jgi:hypothetical protein
MANYVSGLFLFAFSSFARIGDVVGSPSDVLQIVNLSLDE